MRTRKEIQDDIDKAEVELDRRKNPSVRSCGWTPQDQEASVAKAKAVLDGLREEMDARVTGPLVELLARLDREKEDHRHGRWLGLAMLAVILGLDVALVALAVTGGGR